MKKLLLLACALFIFNYNDIKAQANKIPDGIYLVEKTGNNTTYFGHLTSKQDILNVDTYFSKGNPQDFSKVVVDTSEYVPLSLEKLPTLENETALKKKLLISLAPEASEKLEAFTRKWLSSRAAIVLDDKVITIHKIREVIIGGQMQLTRCGDNACEYLYTKLKSNVAK